LNIKSAAEALSRHVHSMSRTKLSANLTLCATVLVSSLFASPFQASAIGPSEQFALQELKPGLNSFYGDAVDARSDINNDGVGDIVVADAALGKLFVYSGVDGSALQTHQYRDNLDSTQAELQYQLATGDVNCDGYGDILIADLNQTYSFDGHTNRGVVDLFSGKDGVHSQITIGVKHTGIFARTLSVIGDAGGSPCNDIAVGSSDYSGAGALAAVHIMTADNQLLYRIVSPDPYVAFGESLAALSDIDGDSVADLIVGGHSETTLLGRRGKAFVYSGKTGNLLYTFSSPSGFYDRYGNSVAAAGDVNNDAVEDIIVGAFHRDGSADSGQRVYLYSGRDGSSLGSIVSTSNSAQDRFGWSSEGVGDLDGDGHGDLVISAPNEVIEAGSSIFGAVRIYSGKSLALLATIRNSIQGTSFGMALSPWKNASGQLGLLAGARGGLGTSFAGYAKAILVAEDTASPTPTPSATPAEDTVGPTLSALSISIQFGKKSSLRYELNDDSGMSQEKIKVTRANKVRKSLAVSMSAIPSDGIRKVRFNPKGLPKGKYVYCVTATDIIGNVSEQSCASLRIK
jgi:hypothetical protein